MVMALKPEVPLVHSQMKLPCVGLQYLWNRPHILVWGTLHICHDHVPVLPPPAQEAFCPPRFIQKMKNLRVMEGDTVRLECKILASPAPQLYWKKDKEMLSLNPSRMRWDITCLTVHSYTLAKGSDHTKILVPPA